MMELVTHKTIDGHSPDSLTALFDECMNVLRDPSQWCSTAFYSIV